MVPRNDVRNLTEAIVRNIAAGRTVNNPFFHLEFDRVFPDDVYASMLAAMPAASEYRALPGRNGGNIRLDGSSTRVKIDLFPEYIRHLTSPKREILGSCGPRPDVRGRSSSIHAQPGTRT